MDLISPSKFVNIYFSFETLISARVETAERKIGGDHNYLFEEEDHKKCIYSL